MIGQDHPPHRLECRPVEEKSWAAWPPGVAVQGSALGRSAPLPRPSQRSGARGPHCQEACMRTPNSATERPLGALSYRRGAVVRHGDTQLHVEWMGVSSRRFAAQADHTNPEEDPSIGSTRQVVALLRNGGRNRRNT